ncbi:MAG: hypothetical protein QOG42_241 [Solirubrobacteraceae bacterium]|jgi:hypothetical protein|nr:hypothetical protein [Solirubrobacteraceae bacterium]
MNSRPRTGIVIAIVVALCVLLAIVLQTLIGPPG